MNPPVYLWDVKQGSQEWTEARRGVLTASSMDRVVTSSGASSKQAQDLLLRLVAEWLSGEVDDSFQSNAMMRGYMLQPEALEYYVLQRGTQVREVGHVYLDDRRLVGCSPDGLIGEDGGLEIKCPLGKGHVKTLIEQKVPTGYVVQIQTCLMVTGRDWWDYLSYHPKMPAFLHRVERDEKLIDSLRKGAEAFSEAVLSVLHQFSDHITEKVSRETPG